MPNVGPMELILLLIVLLLVFGPKRLPEMGRSVGKGIREFKDSVSGNEKPEEPAPAVAEQAAPPPQVITEQAAAPAPAAERSEQSETDRVAN
ncbi:MAG TPA: twin-arginine translocase TatA/TatE family subunit [Gaiellaceae bacterium]|jgi:sec-independent protein translocase protein TatA